MLSIPNTYQQQLYKTVLVVRNFPPSSLPIIILVSFSCGSNFIKFAPLFIYVACTTEYLIVILRTRVVYELIADEVRSTTYSVLMRKKLYFILV